MCVVCENKEYAFEKKQFNTPSNPSYTSGFLVMPDAVSSILLLAEWFVVDFKASCGICNRCRILRSVRMAPPGVGTPVCTRIICIKKGLI